MLSFFESRRGGLMSLSVEDATRRELERLEALDSALGAVALTLARALDDGAGMAAAAVSKELRATLKELTPRDGGDPFAEFMASLSAPVRDPSSAGAPNSGL
jgi:hypothetical protein